MSAIAVLFWHYQNFWITPDGVVGFNRDQQPLYHLFSAFYQYGKYGVQIFWSISGYIFFWKYRSAISTRLITGRNFFFLRFSRLYPLHFATLLLVAALQAAYFRVNGHLFGTTHDDLYHFGLQLLMASNWGFQVGSSFNVPIWSISIEILVYILFFLVLRCLGASVLWSVGIVLAGALGYFLSHADPIFECVVCFYIGGLMAWFAATPVARSHHVVFRYLTIGALVALPLLGESLHLFKLKAAFQVFSIGYVALLLFFMAEHCRFPDFLDRFITAGGNMTYSSYLIHFPIQLSIAIFCTYGGWVIPKQSVVFFVLYFAAVLLFAVLIYRHFEMPCQRLIRSSFLRRR